MKAKSIKGDSPGTIKVTLEDSVKDGYQPTLAFVFLTIVNDIDAITAILDAKGIAVFGASTAEKFNEDGIDSNGIVILLLDMHVDNFTVVVKDFESPATAYETASTVGEIGKKSFQHPAFIISTADIRIPGQEIIKGLLDKAGIDVTIIGGAAGEPVTFTGTIFTNQTRSSSGLIALIVDEDKVEVKGVAVSGWKPVGIEKTITKSDGNWVFTINNEPAIEVVKKFLGKEIVTTDKSIGLGTYPLQVQRAYGKPMMRPIIFWNVEVQSIMLGAPVEEGDKFRFFVAS